MYPLVEIIDQLRHVNLQKAIRACVLSPSIGEVCVGRRAKTLINLAVHKHRGFRCECCGKEARYYTLNKQGTIWFNITKKNYLTVDHQIPKLYLREHGLRNPGIRNFKIYCFECNYAKGGKYEMYS